MSLKGQTQRKKGYKMDLDRIAEIVVVAVMGITVGFAVAKKYHEDDMKAFQTEAVVMECGFYNKHGEFDWKYPELTWVDVED